MDYEYFSKHYKLIAIDLSKQIELENSDLKQQINFIETLENDRATMFFIIGNDEIRKNNVNNNVFVDEANHIYIAMPMNNLVEYSNNYSDTSGSLWQFKGDEVPANNADLSIDNSESFKYKAALVGETKHHNDGKSFVKDTKIVVPLKYLSNFWRSLEMLLINCKVCLELNWTGDCVLSSDRNSAKFETAGAKLNVPIVAVSTKDNLNLTKQLSDGFKKICLLEELSNKACIGNRKRKKPISVT